MAITFRGFAKTLAMPGNDAVLQPLFAIENGIASRVNVHIKRFVYQVDSIALYAAVLPLVKAARATGVSGGVCVEKTTYDTTQTSDPAVTVKAQNAECARLSATLGTTVWQQFSNRTHTAIEQQYVPDRLLLPRIVETQTFKLRPGEALACSVVGAAAAANAFASQNWMVECAWEEDAIPTFAISGFVKLSTVAKQYARVMILEATDRYMANAVLKEVVITDVNGAWNSSIRSGWVGAAFVQYESGGTFYTAPGSPFLEA